MTYTNYILYQFTTAIDLSSEMGLNQTVNVMLSITIPLLNTVLIDLKNANIPFENFTFQRNTQSGLTNRCGLYLIVNKNNKKIYLGSSQNLALRKADYNRNFNNPDRLPKVLGSMREDLQNDGPESFFFIPLLVFERSKVLYNNTTTAETEDKQFKNFLDLHLENALLTHYLSPTSEYKNLFYNVKTIGVFQPRNTYGGSPTSGKASKCLRFKDEYAWESISGAALSLLVDRHTIRNLKDRGKLIEISMTEFNEFTGIKIQNIDANSFFTQPENHRKFLKLRGSKGLNLRMNDKFQEFLTKFSLGNGEP